MTELWWLRPEWKQTVCACGQNIWKSGGDPDWGCCYDCFEERHRREPEPEYHAPLCDICGKHESCASESGKNVCSEACDHEARRLAECDRAVKGEA